MTREEFHKAAEIVGTYAGTAEEYQKLILAAVTNDDIGNEEHLPNF